MNHIAPILTPAHAATLSLEDLVKAAAAQVDAQNPGLSDEQLMERSFELVDALATEEQRMEFALAGIREMFDEVADEHLGETAARLLNPRLRHGELFGVIAYRGNDGEERHVHLKHARVSDLERPFHVHHRTAYLACARLLRQRGYVSYAEAYAAGVFGGGAEAS